MAGVSPSDKEIEANMSAPITVHLVAHQSPTNISRTSQRWNWFQFSTKSDQLKFCLEGSGNWRVPSKIPSNLKNRSDIGTHAFLRWSLSTASGIPLITIMISHFSSHQLPTIGWYLDLSSSNWSIKSNILKVPEFINVESAPLSMRRFFTSIYKTKQQVPLKTTTWCRE